MTPLGATLALLILITTGCDVSASRDQTATREQGQAQPVWDAQPCSDDRPPDASDRAGDHPSIIGRPPGTLIAAFGTPSGDEGFIVGAAPGLFFRPYGPGHPNAGKPGRVLIWTKANCEMIVVFIAHPTGWRAVEAFEAIAGADY